jgi:hypothetical protein
MFILDLTSLILNNYVQDFVTKWYFVPGYQDAYCVGSDGSVWSRYVKVGMKWIIGGMDDWVKLSLNLNKAGYLQFFLYFNGIQKVVRVHRLVTEIFLGSCPVGQEVCHEDGDRQNNHVCNLRYDTKTNNFNDRLKHGTHPSGERNGHAFLTQVEVDFIREEFATGKYTKTQLGWKYGVTVGCIGRIVRNETWVDPTFEPKYCRPNIVLTQIIADQIRVEFATGKYTQKQLGEKHQVSRANIGCIVRNETWVVP